MGNVGKFKSTLTIQNSIRHVKCWGGNRKELKYRIISRFKLEREVIKFKIFKALEYLVGQ